MKRILAKMNDHDVTLIPTLIVALLGMVLSIASHSEEYFQVNADGGYSQLKDKVAALRLLITNEKTRIVRCDEVELSNKATLRKK